MSTIFTDQLKLIAFDVFIKRWGRPFTHFQLKKRYTLDLIRDLLFNSLLEIGCQDGLLSILIGQQFPVKNILGIDLNERTIKTANHMAAKLPGLNAEFRVEDMDTFDLTEKFDLILLIDVIQFSANPQLLLEKVKSFLNPNGKLILYVPTYPQKRILFHMSAIRNLFLPNFNEKNELTVDHLNRILRNAGFEIECNYSCYHQFATVAKEMHYITAKIHPIVTALLFPVLNILTLFDRGKKEGNGVFFRLSRIS